MRYHVSDRNITNAKMTITITPARMPSGSSTSIVAPVRDGGVAGGWKSSLEDSDDVATVRAAADDRGESAPTVKVTGSSARPAA